MSINILLDTNILISIFNGEQKTAKMTRLIDRLSYHIFFHPIQKEDFERDKNIERRNHNLARLRQYNELIAPPIPTSEDLMCFGWAERSENDHIDNCLLFALQTNCVHFLITEDLRAIRKVRSSDLEERVFRLDEFVYYLERKSDPKFHVPVGIEDVFLYILDMADPFWGSLRATYEGFDKWLQNASRGQRRVWCVREDRRPLAVCIYKTEEPENITDDQRRLSGKILKLCTFKVGPELQGKKIGERLLYTAFKYAYEGQYDYVYLHTNATQQERLVDLCCDYGFKFFGKYRGDDVYVKKMKPPEEIPPDISVVDFAKDYYPYFQFGENIQKFIVPIRPSFHNDLFPDISDDANTLFAVEFCKEKPQSNTIKKAYLCHANTRQINPGDILLFYRSVDRRSIEVMGIVEKTFLSKDFFKIQTEVAKRSVYSEDQLNEISAKETRVLLFRFIKSFAPISSERLKELGINGSIQSIRKIDHQKYLLLMEQR